jgi:hypothetical protein
MKNILNFVLIIGFALILNQSLEIGMVASTFASVVFAFILGQFKTVGQMNALVCGEISRSIVSDCDFPLIAGIRKRMLVANWEQVTSVDINSGNRLLIEDIVLDGNLFEISGRDNTIVANFALVPASQLLDHTVTAMGFDISPATKQNIQGMIDGRFVVFVENVDKGQSGMNAFEIFGLDSGLKMVELTRDATNIETQGAFAFKFMSSDISKEPMIPRTFYDGVSYATTKAILAALIF